jgi:hypothetical protein
MSTRLTNPARNQQHGNHTPETQEIEGKKHHKKSDGINT